MVTNKTRKDFITQELEICKKKKIGENKTA